MENRQLNLYNSEFSIKNKILRVLWNSVYFLLFRPFPTPVFRTWRIFVLKCFGAQIHFSSHVYASVKIWAPWNLSIGEYSCLGPYVDCYNQGKVYIGNHTIISQKSNLCASTHDHKKKNFPLLLKPIKIQDRVWIASNAIYRAWSNNRIKLCSCSLCGSGWQCKSIHHCRGQSSKKN